jgi:hypothetical protein
MERLGATCTQRPCSTSGRIALAPPPPFQRPSLATARARKVLKRELTAVRAAADGASMLPK